MAKTFTLSTDSCVDMYKSELERRGIYCINLKYILDDQVVSVLYEKESEYDDFYNLIAKGAMPTTTQINPQEFKEHFEKILAAEKEGDIIHISLSGGLSKTCENAKNTADEMNKTLNGRKIYVLDSLICCCGIEVQLNRFEELRKTGVPAEKAIKIVEELRDGQNVWIIVNDLFHLKRGGRISGPKAVIGTVLGIKPIIIFAANGKLAIENKMRGTKKAVAYILSKMKEMSNNSDFSGQDLYVIKTSQSDTADELDAAVRAMYPKATVKHRRIGPIIGTHVGNGMACVLFNGKKRLDI